MKYAHFLIALLVFSAALTGFAEDRLKPYVLGKTVEKDTDAEKARVLGVLKSSSFEVIGEYSPRPGSHIICITSDALKTKASESEFGGYGAALHVAVTASGTGLQVSWTNPLYIAQLYRMNGTLEDVAGALEKLLGPGVPFGSEKGIPAGKLRKYHYMIGMPRFDGQHLLAEYDSQEAAIKAVEEGLAAGAGGTQKVFRVDVPGKEESLFGVAVLEGKGADKVVFETCDTAEKKHTAYAPWEILVTGGKAYAHHGRFRIAASFPDLGMGTFMKIVSAPGAIKDALEAAAKGAPATE